MVAKSFMKYRYLVASRSITAQFGVRNRVNIEVQYLDEQGFMDIETPFLIKSTPEVHVIS